MTRITLICIVASIFLLDGMAVAQSAKTVLSPETIKKTFLTGTDQAKEELSEELNLRGGQESGTCVWFQSPQVYYPALQSSHDWAVVVLRSEQCWWDFLVILRHTSKQWQLVSTYPIFGKSGHSPVSFPSLLKQGEQEIMIQRDNLVSGSGEWQYDTVIFRLVNGRPEVIFDETQELNFSIPAETGNTEESEKGTFFLIPSNDSAIAISDILEEQEIVRHKHRVVRWRIFTWWPEISRFRSQAIDEASANRRLIKLESIRGNPR